MRESDYHPLRHYCPKCEVMHNGGGCPAKTLICPVCGKDHGDRFYERIRCLDKILDEANKPAPEKPVS